MSNIEDYRDPDFEVWSELAYVSIAIVVVVAVAALAVHNMGIRLGWYL